MRALRALLTVGVAGVVAGGLGIAPPVAAAPPPAEQTYDDCDALVQQHPDKRTTYSCYYRVGRLTATFGEAQQRLEALVEQRPTVPWIRYALSNVLVDIGERHLAKPLMAGAVAELDGYPDVSVSSHTIAMLDLGLLMADLGEFEIAKNWLTRAHAIASEGKVESLAAAATLELASVMRRMGGEIAEQRQLVDEALPKIVGTGHYTLEVKALLLASAIAYAGGDSEAADRHSRNVIELTAAKGDHYLQAQAETALLRREVARLDLGAPGDTSQLRQRAEAVLALARRADNHHAEARALVSLGELQPDDALALANLQRGLELEDELQRPIRQVGARGSLVDRLARLPSQAGRALAIAQRSEELAADGAGIEVMRDAAEQVSVAAWAGGHRHLAIESSLRSIELAELFRELQFDEIDRRDNLRIISGNYYRLAGELNAQPNVSREDLELSFRTMERLRARSLLERLTASDIAPLDPDDAAVAARQATLREIGVVQRRLVGADLPDHDRREALATLERLETREREQRTALARENPTFGALRMPDPPALSQVMAGLHPDEAIIAYQVADAVDAYGRPEGGSWVTVITRDEIAAHRIPDRRTLRQQVPMLAGLIARRDGSAATALARLHRDLLADALASLPDHIDKLTIVADGVLYEVPFAALRPDADAPPVAARFEVTLTPSVSSLMRWRALPGPPSTRVLALALAGAGPLSSMRDTGTLQTGLSLGELPRAEEEARAIATIVDGAEVHVGDEASERFIKEAALHSFGMLHFATHAVMDRDHPERSAVVLASGSDDEDGLLQAREVVSLPLSGQVVVLSACSGASGAAVRGEGVMSLARAFLHAGAHAVVASRWPLDDEDALKLFARLYHHLASGESLAGALHRAQLDRIEAGAPPAAWAGVVILGRGDLVLHPRSGLLATLRGLVDGRRLGIAAALCLVGLGLVMAWRRRPAARRA